jgi:NADH-quinone oxidoreductase subunit N
MLDLLTTSVVVLAGAALGLPLTQLWGGDRKLPGYVLAVVLAVTMVLVGLYGANPAKTQWFGTLLAADSLGSFFGLVTLGVTLMVTVVSVSYYRTNNGGIYYGLLASTALGMLLLSFSQDLLILFISWELMSIPTYVLAGFDKKRPQSNEASVKYAVIGALSSAILLYAISLAYGLTGSTQMAVVVRGLAASPSLLGGLCVLLFVAGFGFKMSIVPFHMWIPDTYEGAPNAITTLLAAATKKAGFIAAIRVLLAIATLYVITQSPLFSIANVLAVLALVTMTLGNVAALTQKSMMRLLAYSSIAQAGYILVGFVPYAYNYQSTAATIGMTGVLFHVLNHAVMKGVAFLAAGLVLLELRRTDTGAYNGLGRRMPFTAFTMTIAFLGLAGVPPLNGFWSKLLLFLSVASPQFVWLAVAGIVNSAFSLGYYAWVIKRMYLDDPESQERVKEPLVFVVVFAIAVGLIIGIGLFPQSVINYASNAVTGIFPSGG